MDKREPRTSNIDEVTARNIYLALAAATFNLESREEAEAILLETRTDPAELNRKIPGFAGTVYR